MEVLERMPVRLGLLLIIFHCTTSAVEFGFARALHVRPRSRADTPVVVPTGMTRQLLDWRGLANSSFGALNEVTSYGEGCLLWVLVVYDHRRQPESFSIVSLHWSAEDSSCVPQHECHLQVSETIESVMNAAAAVTDISVTLSLLACRADMIRSPSFSLDSSSITTTMRPRAMASRASSIEANSIGSSVISREDGEPTAVHG